MEQLPWSKQEVCAKSKKDLVIFLRSKASHEFLKTHRLRGEEQNVIKRSSLAQLKKVYFELFESVDNFKSEKDDLVDLETSERKKRVQAALVQTRSVPKLYRLVQHTILKKDWISPKSPQYSSFKNLQLLSRECLQELMEELLVIYNIRYSTYYGKTKPDFVHRFTPFLISSLQEIVLIRFRFDDKFLLQIAQNCTSLDTFLLGYCSGYHTETIIDVLASLSTLSSLSLYGAPFTTTVVNNSLKKMKPDHLTFLDISEIRRDPETPTNHVFETLTKFTQLRALQLEGVQVTHEDQDGFKKLISKLPNLTTAFLNLYKLCNGIGDAIQTPNSLTNVSIADIDNTGFIQLMKQCDNIKILNLIGCEKLTHESFVALRQSKTANVLENLKLDYCTQVTNSDFTSLMKGGLPELKEIGITYCHLDFGSLQYLSQCTKLTKISAHTDTFTDECVEVVVKSCKELISLKCGSQTNITNKTMEILANNNNKIAKLTILAATIDTSGFKIFANSQCAKALTKLTLKCDISDIAFGFLTENCLLLDTFRFNAVFVKQQTGLGLLNLTKLKKLGMSHLDWEHLFVLDIITGLHYGLWNVKIESTLMYEKYTDFLLQQKIEKLLTRIGKRSTTVWLFRDAFET